jgi:hypothetical protein
MPRGVRSSNPSRRCVTRDSEIIVLPSAQGRGRL